MVPGSTYEFQILAIVETGSGTIEKVIDGETGMNIVDCDTDSDAFCTRGNELADNIGAVYTALFNANLLSPSTAPYPLENIADSWFVGSELQYQLAAFGSTALPTVNITSIVGHDFTITYGSRELWCNFLTVPVNAAYFMGYSI